MTENTEKTYTVTLTEAELDSLGNGFSVRMLVRMGLVETEEEQQCIQRHADVLYRLVNQSREEAGLPLYTDGEDFLRRSADVMLKQMVAAYLDGDRSEHVVRIVSHAVNCDVVPADVVLLITLASLDDVDVEVINLDDANPDYAQPDGS